MADDRIEFGLDPLLIAAPLAPAAMAAVVGIVVDRFVEPAVSMECLVIATALAAWWWLRQSPFRAWAALAVVAGAFAVHHHGHRWRFSTDEIGHQIAESPQLAKVRGRVAREPAVDPPDENNLLSLPRPATTRTVLAVDEWSAGERWAPCSGRASLTIHGLVPGLRAGDRIEIVGWISRIAPPSNPGERDRASQLRDQRILAGITVQQGSDGVEIFESTAWRFDRFIAGIRGAGQRVLQSQLDSDTVGVAEALLLGEGGSFDRAGWQRYIRTGVVHVLAISGQHFVVLAWVFAMLGQWAGVRRRRMAVLIAIVLTIYMFVTGARPPVVRAAVMVLTAALAAIARRHPSPANSLALSGLVVLMLNPTDLADPGCQFSFLCVAVLIFGTARWFAPQPIDPLEQVTDAARPIWLRSLRTIGEWILFSYAVTWVLGLAVLPLAVSRYHLLSWVGLVIGPPVILLTSIALTSGFALILVGSVSSALAWPFAVVTNLSLRSCEWIVSNSDRWPGAAVWVGEIPMWWLVVFYAGLSAALVWPWFNIRPRWCLSAAVVWAAVGWGLTAIPPSRDGLVVTFLAVGHGGCTVIETPDGRTLMYDAGALSGPEVTRRVIAPFLWHRRIARIDELFLSHADLDHFNGLPDVLDRFHVGLVSLTPSFESKESPGAKAVASALARHRVPRRVLTAGDRLDVGEVFIDVLHPPESGPPGIENVRSLTLVVRHQGHSILLTGDLERDGLNRLLALPPTRVHVLMAPHHGSATANPPELAAWSRPMLVVSCQGPAFGGAQRTGAVYKSHGAQWWPTFPNGAVTVTSQAGRLTAETFATSQRMRLTP